MSVPYERAPSKQAAFIRHGNTLINICMQAIPRFSVHCVWTGKNLKGPAFSEMVLYQVEENETKYFKKDFV